MRVAIAVSGVGARERRWSDGTRSLAVLRRDPETGRQAALTATEPYAHLTADQERAAADA